jgi:hypothetical protein
MDAYRADTNARSLLCHLLSSLPPWAHDNTDPDKPGHDCMADPPDNTRIPRLWGYVPAATVATTDTVKQVNKKTGQLRWRTVRNCDPSESTSIRGDGGGSGSTDAAGHTAGAGDDDGAAADAL